MNQKAMLMRMLTAQELLDVDDDLLSVIGNLGREMNVDILAPGENSAIEQYVRLLGVINVETQNTIFRRSPL